MSLNNKKELHFMGYQRLRLLQGGTSSPEYSDGLQRISQAEGEQT